MKYRKMIGGDYSFGNNAQDFYSGTLAVAQAIKTNLKLLYGEWWENKDKGLPLFENIMGQIGTPDKIQTADLIIQDVIKNTTGVQSILGFESAYENRVYTVKQCTVQTIYGDVVLEEVTF